LKIFLQNLFNYGKIKKKKLNKKKLNNKKLNNKKLNNKVKCEECMKEEKDLELCDMCKKNFHKECLKVEKDDKEKSCNLCIKCYDNLCKICNKNDLNENLKHCDNCNLNYHINCFKETEFNSNTCPDCLKEEKLEIDNLSVDVILDRRSFKDNDLDSFEYLIKFAYNSYNNIQWMSERRLILKDSVKLNNFLKKYESNTQFIEHYREMIPIWQTIEKIISKKKWIIKYPSM